MQLKAADARYRSRRSANFRRIVRKSGNVIAVKRGGVCKLVSGNMHAIAGVAREANDRLIEFFFLVFYRWNFCECRHSCPEPPLICELPLSPWGARLNHKDEAVR